ncbi:glycoside hydrolase family 127 protein [Evansella sp. AB-P1]|uniref:glycoside hydrolase family 127 protein n=1 Tax=Evansella sp. AB-P1 TaxID=3037653 RepID=UPI00241CE5F8|nr:beta-L-arabinofuranosidase domain-containing protein [Evansella sp. AB-P1]MDG5785883.1 glycoside hydrolase family 127 protein [Evansella sp. AB-P1]
MLIDTRKSKYAKVYSLPVQAINWNEGFWKERFDVCADVTVPHIRSQFEDDSTTFHVVENFRVAAGVHEGKHAGTPFGDGDFYKWMEAAMYVMAKRGDKELERDLDAYIELICKAQQSDGYISTKQIIADMNSGGNSRLGNVNDFEVYNFGHLMTAACAYKRITGKDSFLCVAEKAAKYLSNLYEEQIRKGESLTEVCPSHYMGIVELYRTTGKNEYLKLAEMALKARDLVKNGTDDNQDRLPVREHRKIVGHGVRSTYLYSGVADIYLEKGEEALKTVLDSVWENCVDKKLYINGGCGALYSGTSPYGKFSFDMSRNVVHQAFGYEYQLPNITGYNETCATIGNIMWNLRMFAIDPQAKYFDIIERSMLNLSIASVSLSGNRYFYQNALRRVKKLDHELMWPLERTGTLTCFCCPPNMARIIAESSEYAYMISDDSVYTGMYGANTAEFRMSNGADFTIVQKTEYPWDGRVVMEFGDVKKDRAITVKLRVPGWLTSGYITVNGEKVSVLDKSHASSYYSVDIEKLAGTRIELQMDMPVRLTMSHSHVEENINQVAVERGPLLYCLESLDVPLSELGDFMLPASATFKTDPYEICGKTVLSLETEGLTLNWNKEKDRQALYQTLDIEGAERVGVRMIPYFAWDNRGNGEMMVWLPLYFGELS